LGVSHVAINVKNAEIARAFYGEFLGFAQPFTLKRTDGTDWICFTKINDAQYFELFIGDSRNRGSFNHFALYTDDLSAMQYYLSSHGVRLAEPVRTTRTGNSLLSVLDPEGNLIEIVQYQSGSWIDGAKGKFLPTTRISDHITHLGLAVRNPAPVIRFYRDILGFKQLARRGGGGEALHPIRLRVPDGSDYVELVTSDTHLTASNAAQNYIGLLSRDVPNTVAILRSRPNAHSYADPTTPSGLPLRTTLFDSDGTQLEILGQPAGNPQSR
jgi:lactoylglutathione lyase